ncbi:N-acetyltransferase [Lacrimispora amygdalina]|uniref:N-acetyltransferase n=1 Tax=Lacrimispora amygdalina TaxID=253257 RepID=A0A3E2NFG8_9FIRM|nr:GNAT family protein [Clostridium indicum]RFZ79703.1 N-acetyltransferase [Clostridium indicum]
MKDIIYKNVPIITKRLCIKKITADELILIREETKYEEFYKMTCRPIFKMDKNELEEFYKNMIQKENTVIFSITRIEDGALIGKVSFNDYNPRNNSMELGYYIIPRYRKNGYMSEALTNLFNVLFGIIRINKIYAQTASFNAQSIGLLKKMNFKKDAILRDHHELDGKLYDEYIFSVLYKEWECFKS